VGRTVVHLFCCPHSSPLPLSPALYNRVKALTLTAVSSDIVHGITDRTSKFSNRSHVQVFHRSGQRPPSGAGADARDVGPFPANSRILSLAAEGGRAPDRTLDTRNTALSRCMNERRLRGTPTTECARVSSRIPLDPNQHPPEAPFEPACAREETHPGSRKATQPLRLLEHLSRHTCDADLGHCESAA
jgi:hypothetical protein